VNHFADPEFWKRYERLSPEVQETADKNFKLLKSNPKHPSLHFKQIKKYWSVRVNLEIRALAVATGEDYVWFWIGGHKEYDRIIDNQKKR
jgi:hypothetical protein